MSRTIRIAVLMTVHNRRDQTLQSLAALHGQKLRPKVCVDTYLVDDGSTDGTAEAIRRQFPNVKVLQGTGNLYWVGGMRLAFAEAAHVDYHYHLWLNDDTVLFPDTIHVL